MFPIIGLEGMGEMGVQECGTVLVLGSLGSIKVRAQNGNRSLAYPHLSIGSGASEINAALIFSSQAKPARHQMVGSRPQTDP